MHRGLLQERTNDGVLVCMTRCRLVYRCYFVAGLKVPQKLAHRGQLIDSRVLLR